MTRSFVSLIVALIFIVLASGCSEKMEKEKEIKESLAEMRAMAAELGKPSHEEDILYFGTTRINENFEIVDAIQEKYGCTATFFENRAISSFAFPPT
ncbi:MAG: hypothetical protein U5N56_10585 [Candidatus Marinimicrobia bacterium]|nr:hypothetical protein [Candidatus Neomarinimicrobiota bacterium]